MVNNPPHPYYGSPTVFEASRITVTRPCKSGITVQGTVLSIFLSFIKNVLIYPLKVVLLLRF